MSLMRNFTKRARAHTRGEEPTIQARSCTVKYAPGTINRAKISLPTELLSTTNVHALNAPDIRKASAETSSSSSADSVHSDNDFSSIDKGFLSADNSSATDLSPITPMTPFSETGLNNDVKDFFSSRSIVASVTSTPASEPTPAVPKRAPSHSKRAHIEVSRQRSFNRSMSPPPTDISKSTNGPGVRDSVAMFGSPKSGSSERSHPFGRELAKVHEVAEGFGAAGMVLDEEEQEMLSKGLQKFTVADYLAELTGMHIHGFSGGVYEDQVTLNPFI